jgi:hypothetical protein
MPRFAILEHRWNGVHWDLLFERGETLATWAIDAPMSPGAGQPARALADHRLVYLSYEGPVSGDRGEVRRVAEGTYIERRWEPDEVVLTLSGETLSGELSLRRSVAGGWWLRFGN